MPGAVCKAALCAAKAQSKLNIIRKELEYDQSVDQAGDEGSDYFANLMIRKAEFADKYLEELFVKLHEFE